MKSSHSVFVSLRQRRQHVRIWGPDEAPALFLCHGWSDVSATWQFLVDCLSNNWRVIAPDWRGFGLSEANHGPYWFPDYLADLDGLLEHFSPDAPVNLVGHSMGGNICALYAGIRPQRVARLVNLEGAGLPRHDPEEAPERYAQWLEQLRGEAPEFRPYADMSVLAQRLRKENPRLDADKAAWLAKHSGVEDNNATVRLNFDPYHRLVNPVLYRLEEAFACWRRVTAPVLFIGAYESKIFERFYPIDSDDFRERLAACPQLEAVFLEDCGHNIHHDQPEKLAELIENFIPFVKPEPTLHGT